MTYSQFLNSLLNGIQLFKDTFTTIVNYLMTNYIFITILGLVLFISLFRLLFDLVVNYFKKDLDDVYGGGNKWECILVLVLD